MLDIRDYLLTRGEHNAAYPQSILELKNSDLECYGISNQYEDSFKKIYELVERYQIPIKGFAYESKRIPCIPIDSLEMHTFFSDKNKEGININIIACFNPCKNQDLLRYIEGQACVKSIYILDGYTYHFAWENNSWEYREVFLSRKIRLVDSYCPWERRITADFLATNIDIINETFNLLEDDLSRRTMVACFDGYISLQDFAMSNVISLNEQYFDEGVIRINDGESFVDCGAFIGDSIAPFVQFCKSRDIHYDKIFAFEPDKKAYALLEKEAAHYRNCYAMPFATSDKEGEMQLEANFGASKVVAGSDSSGGTDVVSAITIDEHLKEEKITFIKMDLEGGEMAALRGSRNTIAKRHPKLAICVYHKPEDWITIPQFIKSLSSGYRFYVRGYFNNLSEIVLYAV